MADTAHRLVAILRGLPPTDCEAVVSLLIEEGFRAIEVPLNSPDPFSSIACAAGLVRRHCGDAALVGAGTVLTTAEVRRVKEAGGNLIVSPNCDKEVIAETIQLNMASFPGVFTPTEALAAIAQGATNLKIFPANSLGAAGIKGMKAVLPSSIPLYAVGGVAEDDFADYVAAGCAGFGIGSHLYHPEMSLSDIRARARRLMQACDKAFG